ncbi:hypothetical protein C8R46DRAFT_1276018 [Mycena filopes]|nr:hypothetical protein C8R46DRAFT_1276018 [Mycena filopes]
MSGGGSEFNSPSSFLRLPRQFPAYKFYVYAKHGVGGTDATVTTPPGLLRTLVDYFSAFPLLESVRIQGLIDDGNMILDRPKSIALPSRLHTIHIEHPTVANWLRTLNPPPTQLVHLGLVNFEQSFEWGGINAYLGSVAAESITTLTLTEGGLIVSHPFTADRPNLQRLRSLRHLVIVQSHYFAPSTLLGILSDLQSCPGSKTLQTITVSMELCISRRLNTQDWGIVDALLADTTSYPCLRSITLTTPDAARAFSDKELQVIAEYMGIPLPLADAFRKILFKCQERGLLVFDLPAK